MPDSAAIWRSETPSRPCCREQPFADFDQPVHCRPPCLRGCFAHHATRTSLQQNYVKCLNLQIASAQSSTYPLLTRQPTIDCRGRTERVGAMATLVSVNVGLPKNVAWNGRTVYTGVWKQSVVGPRMVRRLNVDGDGQGDLAGTVEKTARCWCISLIPTGIGRTNCIATTCDPAILARISPSRVCRTMRCASGIDTGLGRPSSKSANRGSPATGSA